MAQFSVNAQRFDPYKNFKFRVKWDGKYVAGVSKVGMLKRTTEVVKHREGGDPSSSRKSPGAQRIRGDFARTRTRFYFDRRKIKNSRRLTRQSDDEFR